MPGSNAKLSRFFSNYGMPAVLLLLCLYYSFAAVGEQHPVGQAKAKKGIDVEIIARYMDGEKVPDEFLIPTTLYRKQDAEKDPDLK